MIDLHTHTTASDGRSTPAELVARAALGSLRLRRGASVLEFGAGAAPWAAAVLEADPTASAVVNDLEPVLPQARAALGPLGSRCRFAGGDYLTADLEDDGFDVVVLGHVLRAEPDDRAGALVARAASLLAPDGRIVVAEYLAGRDPLTQQTRKISHRLAGDHANCDLGGA